MCEIERVVDFKGSGKCPKVCFSYMCEIESAVDYSSNDSA